MPRYFGLVLMIFNEGAYLTLKSIFHKALNLFQLINLFRLWNHAQIRSWNQLALSNKNKVSWSRKQRGTFDGARTHDLHITSQTCNPLHHATPHDSD